MIIATPKKEDDDEETNKKRYGQETGRMWRHPET